MSRKPFATQSRQTVPWVLIADMQNADAFARCSAEVRIAAELLARIAGDLILLSSGPAGGIGEVLLPKVQPGSSMMPGKVNPVLPMMMQQAAFAVAGNDLSVSMAAAHGQLEINPFEPLIALRLFDSVDLLDSAAMATLLLPALGYVETTRLVQKTAQEGRRLVDLATEGGWIDPGALGQILSDSTELRCIGHLSLRARIRPGGGAFKEGKALT